MFDCPTSASVPHATATPVLVVLSSPCTLVHGACRYFPFPAFMCSPHIKGGETLNERIALQLAEFHAFKAALDLTSKVRYSGGTEPTSQPAAVPASVLAMVRHEASMMPVCCVAHVFPVLHQGITSATPYTKPPVRPADLVALEVRDRSQLSVYQLEVRCVGLPSQLGL
jgi:hypothetical protein